MFKNIPSYSQAHVHKFTLAFTSSQYINPTYGWLLTTTYYKVMIECKQDKMNNLITLSKLEQVNLK
jgi:hypothetical protein